MHKSLNVSEARNGIIIIWRSQGPGRGIFELLTFSNSPSHGVGAWALTESWLASKCRLLCHTLIQNTSLADYRLALAKLFTLLSLRPGLRDMGHHMDGWMQHGCCPLVAPTPLTPRGLCEAYQGAFSYSLLWKWISFRSECVWLLATQLWTKCSTEFCFP